MTFNLTLHGKKSSDIEKEHEKKVGLMKQAAKHMGNNSKQKALKNKYRLEGNKSSSAYEGRHHVNREE